MRRSTYGRPEHHGRDLHEDVEPIDRAQPREHEQGGAGRGDRPGRARWLTTGGTADRVQDGESDGPDHAEEQPAGQGAEGAADVDEGGEERVARREQQRDEAHEEDRHGDRGQPGEQRRSADPATPCDDANLPTCRTPREPAALDHAPAPPEEPPCALPARPARREREGPQDADRRRQGVEGHEPRARSDGEPRQEGDREQERGEGPPGRERQGSDDRDDQDQQGQRGAHRRESHAEGQPTDRRSGHDEPDDEPPGRTRVRVGRTDPGVGVGGGPFAPGQPGGGPYGGG